MLEFEVKNMVSATGNPVPNQFIIHDTAHDVYVFQSYKTTIAKVYMNCAGLVRDKIVLDNDALDYSSTTSKYLYAFLDMNRKEILADKNITWKNLN